jgi:hypothetical protein
MIRRDEAEHIIVLAQRELMYLRNMDFLSPELAKIVAEFRQAGGGQYRGAVSPELSERFRSELSERLARVGFDLDYEPTAEGKIIEDLIDRFSSK